MHQIPDRIDVAFLNQFEEFRQFKDKSNQGGDNNSVSEASGLVTQTQTPDEVMRVAQKQIEGGLAQELLDRIRSAAPDFFERLIVNLLLSMGYGGSAVGAGRAIGRSGDDGVDGVIDQIRWGLTAYTSKPSAMRSVTTSDRVRYAISSAVLIGIRRRKESL